jgi:hypothetical protein
MVKNYYQYINESKIEREGEIKFSSLAGGLKEPVLKFESQRNPDEVGELLLELYSDGPKKYNFKATPEIAAAMANINGMAGEPSKDDMEEVAKLVKEKQSEIQQELLALFTQLDQDIIDVLKKHNVE